MADTDPTTQGAPDAPRPGEESGGGPGPGSPSDMQAGTPTAAEAGAAMQARWGEMGQDDRLIVVGGAIMIVVEILGLILLGWGLGLSSLLTFVGAIVVFVVVLARLRGVPGLSRATILRVAAGVTAAYSLVDLGDLLSSLNSWSGMDIVLSAIFDVVAFVVLWAVWRATAGDAIKDVMGLLKQGGRSMPEWLVAIGSGAVVVSWFVLALGSASFRTEAALAILAAILALTVVWAAAAGAAELKLPIASGLVLAALGIIAAIFALIWLARILEFMDNAPAIAWPGLVVFVAGAAAMAAGGLLGLRQNRPSQSR